MTHHSQKSTKRIALVGASIALVFLMLAMGGVFRTGRIEPGRAETPAQPEVSPDTIVTASIERISQRYEAVGTVRPRTEANISARVSGRILSVLVRPGDFVQKGDALITLDDRDLQARLAQARQGFEAAKAEKERAEHALNAARAVLSEAQANYRRVKTYFGEEAATRQDLERAEAAYRQAQAGVEQAGRAVLAAKAGVERAKQVVEESEVTSGFASISAPQAGQIAGRLVDPGDTAFPGNPLLILQSPGSLRLEAHVREGLIRELSPGKQLPVAIDALDAKLEGTVEEIVPLGDPSSRTFLVKVSLPSTDGLYPGMFGRLVVPLAEREAVVVPRAAIRRIGQMEVVRAEVDGRWTNLFVKTGKEIDGKVEILSGLSGNEKIALRTGDDE